MKLYHLRHESPNTVIDAVYIPECEIFKSYIQNPDCKIIVDYSIQHYLKRAQAVIDGKKDEIQWKIFNEIDIDKKTASRISRAKAGFNQYLDIAGTTENLIRILSERAPKTLAEFFDIKI